MAITPITTNINADLQKPNVCETVYAKQHDRLTRKIAISVFNNDVPYALPSGNDVKYVVRGIKPDGTIFNYEKDENNTNAVTISGSIATVTIAQQVLACPGNTRIEIVIQNNSGTEFLTSFSFLLKIEESAINGPASSNYINPAIVSIADAQLDSDGHIVFTLTNGNTIVTTDTIKGFSGVYVGADPIPEGYNVQIDPNGSSADTVLLKPDIRNYTIQSSAWSSLSDKDPFKYSVSVPANHAISDNYTAFLVNNDPVSFSKWGLSIGGVVGSNLQFISIEKPTTEITLEVRYYDDH